MGKPKVAFVCVHNSCRSQMAEALGKKLADDVFESYSGGTEVKDRINPDAVRMMKKLHGIDMEESQYSKLVSQLPQPDVLEDPTGQSDEVFAETIETISRKILELKEKLS